MLNMLKVYFTIRRNLNVKIVIKSYVRLKIIVMSKLIIHLINIS